LLVGEKAGTMLASSTPYSLVEGWMICDICWHSCKWKDTSARCVVLLFFLAIFKNSFLSWFFVATNWIYLLN
jgi:hypothetical protein